MHDDEDDEGDDGKDAARDHGVLDADAVAAAADEFGVDPARLRALADEVQSVAESVRSVDELVFEYRKAYGDVVVHRTTETYFLRVPPHVWREFGDRVGATGPELSALKSVHAAGLARAVARSEDASAAEADPGTEGGRSTGSDSCDALVLARS